MKLTPLKKELYSFPVNKVFKKLHPFVSLRSLPTFYKSIEDSVKLAVNRIVFIDIYNDYWEN